MVNLNEILNFGIPALLVLIAFGFIYTKFIDPWLMPHLLRFWDYLSNKEVSTSTGKREITYES